MSVKWNPDTDVDAVIRQLRYESNQYDDEDGGLPAALAALVITVIAIAVAGGLLGVLLALATAG